MNMLKLLMIFTIIIGIIYYQLDRYLFYYGKNDLYIYRLLPFKIEPEYTPTFEYGFLLRDEYGFSIVAKGNSYPVGNKVIFINKVLKYGFNPEHLVAVVLDSNKNKYYVNLTRNKNGRPDLIATMKPAIGPCNLNLDKWVYIDGNDANIENLELRRNYSRLIGTILLLTFTYKLVRFSKSQKINKENQL